MTQTASGLAAGERIQAWLTEVAAAPLVVHGAPHEEARRIVLAAVQQAYCERAEEEACGACPACRQVTAGTHPDVLVYEPAGATISVKEVRELIGRGSTTAWSGRRVVVMLAAERLSISAANAFLKTLEESTRSSRYILVTQWRRRLLPTILSRSQSVRLVPEARAASQAAVLPASLLERLSSQTKEPLAEEMLENLTQILIERVRAEGATPQLRSALQRLRDYYLVRSRQGNERVARDLLLSSLPNQ